MNLIERIKRAVIFESEAERQAAKPKDTNPTLLLRTGA